MDSSIVLSSSTCGTAPEKSIYDASKKEHEQVIGVEKEICFVIESVIEWINARSLEKNVFSEENIEG